MSLVNDRRQGDKMVVLLKAALCLKNKNKQYAYFKQGYFSSDTCVFK